MVRNSQSEDSRKESELVNLIKHKQRTLNRRHLRGKKMSDARVAKYRNEVIQGRSFDIEAETRRSEVTNPLVTYLHL